MNKIVSTITVNAPVRVVFEYVRETINLPKLCANLKAVTDIERLPDGGETYKWEYKIANTHFFGTCSKTECMVDHRLTSVIRGGISGTATWLFEPEAKQTQVTLIVEYELPLFFLEKHGIATITRENEFAANSILESLKDMMDRRIGDALTDVTTALDEVEPYYH